MILRSVGVAGWVFSASCGEPRAPIEGNARAGSVAVAPAADTSDCAGDALRPSSAAPAEGLWVHATTSTGRVAVMIGPSRVTAGEARLTRQVETIETRPDGRTIRHALDTASVHLEILPDQGDSLGRAAAAESAAGNHPAAAYAMGSRVVLASYEPCAVSSTGPRLRYLRRDAEGRVLTDVMLRRVSRE